MRNNRRFADLVNNAVFDGEKVIDPDRLAEKDPTEIGIIPQRTKGLFTKQKVRDILKSYEDDEHHLQILLIGIENQMAIHYAMPVKNNLYDVLDYANQVEAIRKLRKKQKSYGSKSEFLSGLTKKDRLVPIITLVLYFGDDPWDGPRSLHDMLDIKDQRILRYIPDYRINLIDPHEIKDFSGFTTELRWLLEALKAGRDKQALIKLFEENSVYRDLDIDTAKMIAAALGMTDIAQENTEQGGVDMCNAVTQIRNEGIAKGRKEGIAEGGTLMVYQMVQDGDTTPERGAKRLNLTIEQLKANMTNTGYRWPES